MTEPFLLQLVNYLKDNYSDKLSEVSLVLPNKRAAVFIKKHFKDVFPGQTIWLPEIITIEDLLVDLSGFTRLSTIELLFAFYEIYHDYEIMNNNAPQAFKDFMGWASFLLNDFNEIDKSNADAEKVFDYLTDLKAMELWSPANIDNPEFTKLQKHYLKFWRTFKPLYFGLKEKLFSEQHGYDGLILQHCINNFETLSKKYNSKKIFFCGFNALNFAEEKLITLFCKYAGAQSLWDVDRYYLENEAHEAGKFLRKYITRDAFKNKAEGGDMFCWIKDYLSTTEKNIEVVGIAGNVAQTKYAGKVIQSLNSNEGSDTALVLANEQLLEPSLNSLPEGLSKINVTMGFPIKNTEAVGWIDALIHLFSEKKPDNTYFYFKTFLSFVQNPLAKIVFGEKLTVPFVSMVERENVVWLSPQFVAENFEEFLKVGSLRKIFFDKQQNVNEFVNNLCEFLEIALERLLLNASSNPIQTESITILKEILIEFVEMNQKYKAVETIHDLAVVFRQLANSGKISFVGEPIGGLQIMGVLETRTLDFDNLVIVACNEDVFPVISKNITFLTTEIKKEFGILANSDKEAIFAYHFYRLIQRAANITIIYNTEPDDFGGSGEMSRYVTQLLYELPKANPKAKIISRVTSVQNDRLDYQEFEAIPKTPEMITSIKENIKTGFSASSLNMYRNCSLKFYYRKVLNLKEREGVEEEMQADTYGTIFHDTVEAIFTPFIGHTLQVETLRNNYKTLHSRLTESFLKHYSAFEFATGKNHLKFIIIEKQVKKLLEFFGKLLNENKTIDILGVEDNLSFELPVPGHGNIVLQGKIDMVVKINGQIHIIDFKTGQVEQRELNLKNIKEDLISKPLDKAFQLLFYAFLISNTDFELRSFTINIYSVKNNKLGLMPVTINNDTVITRLELEEFKTYVQQLLSEIYNSEFPFQKTKEIKICEYCDYKNLCNR